MYHILLLLFYQLTSKSTMSLEHQHSGALTEPKMTAIIRPSTFNSSVGLTVLIPGHHVQCYAKKKKKEATFLDNTFLVPLSIIRPMHKNPWLFV